MGSVLLRPLAPPPPRRGLAGIRQSSQGRGPRLGGRPGDGLEGEWDPRPGRKEGREEGRKEGRKEGRREGGKEGRREGGKEGGREGRREGGREGGKEGGREGWREKKTDVEDRVLELSSTTFRNLKRCAAGWAWEDARSGCEPLGTRE